MLASASTALKIDVDQFRQQLRLLGYSQDETIYLRKFAPKKVKGVAPQNKQCTMRDLPRLQLPDGGLYFVVNGGGQKDEDVTRCRALFWEFDDRPIEEQFFVWREKNLPEPSFQVVTRKSVHTYLAIAGGCTVEQWDELTLDLIDYLGSDPSLKNQSRVMRVAGAWHIAQDAEPVMCELVNVTDKAYSYEELRAAIPQRQPELTPYVEQQAIAPVDLSDRLSDILHKDILPRLGASAYNWTGHDWATESATKKRGCCPWHESESGTAFYIDLVNGEWLWNCPSCQFGGDVVSYRDRLHGGSGKPRGKAYVELVKELASDSGISLPDSKADQNIQSVAIQRQSEPGESQDKVIDSLADLKTLVGQYAAEFDPFKKALIENQIGSDFKVRGSRLEKLVDALTPAEKRDAIDMSSLCQQLAEQIEARSQNPAPTGLATCFYDLDAMTGGLQRGDLIITAGRPSMGKTAFALQSAMNAAKQGANVAVFSLEMSSQQLGTRLLSAETGIEARLINSGRLSGSQWETLGHGITSLSGLSMSMQDGAIETVEQIREVCDRLHAEQPLDLVVIDYLQLMEAEGDNRNIELSRITRKLKKLALDFNVPVNCLSQLSRGVESRKDKRPMMSDLRESGAIEQDADLIMMLYRDEYYNAETVEPAIAEIIITKHRNGPVGTVKLLFEKEYTRFKNLARRAL